MVNLQGQQIKWRFYVAALANAMVNAILMPTMSLYLYDHLQASAAELSLFLGIYTAAGVIYTQLISNYSEQHGRHKSITLGVCISGLLALVIMSNTTEFISVILSAVFLLAAFQGVTALLMGLAFNHFQQEKVKPINNGMLAMISVAWTIGPPIGFQIIEHFGFNTLFYLVMSFLCLVAMLVTILPSVIQALPRSSEKAAWWDLTYIFKHKALLPFLALIVGFSLSIALYQQVLPIYFSQLGISISLTGWLFMLAAIIEIIIILACVRVLRTIRYQTLLIVSALCGVLFFTLLPLSDNVVYQFALQFLKAIFYGLIAGTGVNLFQHLLPSFPTTAATLYYNAMAVGILLAGFFSGAVVGNLTVDWFFATSGMIALVGLLVLVFNPKAQIHH